MRDWMYAGPTLHASLEISSGDGVGGVPLT